MMNHHDNHEGRRSRKILVVRCAVVIAFCVSLSLLAVTAWRLMWARSFVKELAIDVLRLEAGLTLPKDAVLESYDSEFAIVPDVRMASWLLSSAQEFASIQEKVLPNNPGLLMAKEFLDSELPMNLSQRTNLAAVDWDVDQKDLSFRAATFQCRGRWYLYVERIAPNAAGNR